MEVNVTDEDREKTLKCLLKVMDYQLQGMKSHLGDIDNHTKQTEKDLEEYEKVLKKEENQIIMKELEQKMEIMRKQRDGIDDWDEDSFYAKENINLDDIVVQNKMLIDEVDHYLGDSTTSKEDQSVRDSISELSEGLLDKLYSKAGNKK